MPQCHFICYIKSNATVLHNHNLWDNVSTRPYLLLLQGYISGNYQKLFTWKWENDWKVIFTSAMYNSSTKHSLVVCPNISLTFFCNMRFQVPHICHKDLAITKIVMVRCMLICKSKGSSKYIKKYYLDNSNLHSQNVLISTIINALFHM